MASFKISFNFNSETHEVSDMTVIENDILDNSNKIDDYASLILDEELVDSTEQFNFNFE